ncbi:MAG: putative Ig domain-containing protein, partial [Bacteroidota bacterium]
MKGYIMKSRKNLFRALLTTLFWGFICVPSFAIQSPILEPVIDSVTKSGIGSETYAVIHFTHIDTTLIHPNQFMVYISTVTNPTYPGDYTLHQIIPRPVDLVHYKDTIIGLYEQLYSFVVVACSTYLPGQPYCITQSNQSNVGSILLFYGHQTVNITSQPVLEGVVNQAYYYDLNATTSGTYTISYQFSYGQFENPIRPPGMTLNNATGVINWLPQSAGLFDVSVRAALDIDWGWSYKVQDWTIRVRSCSNPTYIDGAIKDTNGLPIRNAKVEAYGAPDNLLDPDGYYETFANDTGYYSVQVMEGNYNLKVSGDAFESEWYQDKTSQQTADAVNAVCGTVNHANFRVLRKPSDTTITFLYEPALIAQAHELYTHDGTATSESGRVVKYLLLEKPQGMTIDDSLGSINWTPTVIGKYHVKLKAYLYTDSANSWAVKEWWVTVKTCGQSTYIKGSVVDENNMTLNSGTVTVYNLTGIDSVGIYTGTINSQGLFSFMIEEGDSKIQVQGESFVGEWHQNRSSKDSATIVSMRCGDTNTVNFIVTRLSSESLTFTSNPVDSSTIGNQYNYTVHAVGQGNRTVNYVLINPPQGMLINKASGLISWTPSVIGGRRITVKAYLVSDSANSFGFQEWWLKTRSCVNPTYMTCTVKDQNAQLIRAGTAFIYNDSGIDSTGIYSGQIGNNGISAIRIEEGFNQIYLEGPDFKSLWYNNKASKDSADRVAVQCGQNKNQEIIVHRYQGYLISGTVVDADSNTAIPNALLTFYSQDSTYTTRSNTDGSYSISLNERFSYFAMCSVPANPDYILQYYDRTEDLTEATPIEFSGNLSNINFYLQKVPQSGNKLTGNVRSS